LEMDMNLSNNASESIRQAKQDMQIIGCFPLYPPLELFSSMGLLPVVLWNLKSSISDLMEADKHVQSYACAIGRELVQFVLTESGKNLDGIFSYNACDTLRNIPEILQTANIDAGRNIPMLRMHVPQVNRAHTNPESYLKNEIAFLISATETAFNVTFSPSAFKQATALYTNMRLLCREAENLVAKGVLSFNRLCDVILSNYFLPIEEQINSLKQVIGSAVLSHPVAPDIGVVISGIMPPPAAVTEAIESSGLRVVANDIASLKRSYAYSPPVTDSPAEYYTDFYTNRFPCTTLLYQTDARLDGFLDLVEQSGARGVILSGEKFCEHEYFEFPILEERLKEKGISTLFLEFGADDVQNISAYTTRVEAFAEMLKQ
jgi:benzoyl-CoA reductase/2-hydroxyglutaryl-CoA dehydratase subunit BcrC/BadD/HgdB